MDRTDDRRLIARLQARNPAAVQELADRYGSRIYQLALRQMKNREDAEEVTQDVLFKVYRSIGTFRGDSALSAWIYRITFNTAMSRLRTVRYQMSQDSERNITSSDGEEQTRTPREAVDLSDLADEHVLRSELRRRVFRAILALPAIYRAPVMLRDIQGMSTEEASAMLH